MALDCEDKIITLGGTCIQIKTELAGVKTELAGVKNLLQEITLNQSELIRLSEKAMHLEKTVDKALIEHDEFFNRLRVIESWRLLQRVKDIEASQKWSRVTIVGAAIMVFCGVLVAWFQFSLAN